VKANGTSALMAAASAGGADAVKVLLDHGAKVDATESVHGQTALMFAAGFNRVAAIKVLLAHHADPNIASVVKKVETVRFDQEPETHPRATLRSPDSALRHRIAAACPHVHAWLAFTTRLGVSRSQARPRLRRHTSLRNTP